MRLEGAIYQSLLPRLRDVIQPTLLIKGSYDPIISEEQTVAFVEKVANGQVKIYEGCGHLAHYEEPDRFAEDVIDFLYA